MQKDFQDLMGVAAVAATFAFLFGIPAVIAPDRREARMDG